MVEGEHTMSEYNFPHNIPEMKHSKTQLSIKHIYILTANMVKYKTDQQTSNCTVQEEQKTELEVKL